MPQVAEDLGCMNGLTGVDGPLGIEPEAAILLPGAEDQACSLLEDRFPWLHPQFQKVHDAFQGGKG